MSGNGSFGAPKEFVDAGLAFPDLPSGLAGQLAPVGSWCYSTRHDTPWPFLALEYVREFESGAHPGDYAVIAHAGRGSASWALSAFVVVGGLGTFIHSSWGGSYSDAETDRLQRERFATCVSAADRLHSAVADRPLEADRCLAVDVSDLRGERWAHWRMGDDVEWIESADAFAVCSTWLTARD